MKEDHSGMTIRKSGSGYKIVDWLNEHLQRRLKTSEEVLAERLGYDGQQVISMMKSGQARVPLDKVETLAKELDVDPSYLFLLALEQHLPGREEDLRRILGRVCSRSDLAFLMRFENVIPHDDRTYTDEQVAAVGRILAGKDAT